MTHEKMVFLVKELRKLTGKDDDIIACVGVDCQSCPFNGIYVSGCKIQKCDLGKIQALLTKVEKRVRKSDMGE